MFRQIIEPRRWFSCHSRLDLVQCWCMSSGTLRQWWYKSPVPLLVHLPLLLLQLVGLSIGPWQNQPQKLSTCWDGMVPHHISHNPHIWMQSPVLHKPIGLDAGPMFVRAVHHLVWCARPWSPQVQLMCQVYTKCPPWLGLPCIRSKNIKEIWVLSYRFGCFNVLP